MSPYALCSVVVESIRTDHFDNSFWTSLYKVISFIYPGHPRLEKHNQPTMPRNRSHIIGETVSGGWTVERYLSSGSYGSVYSVERRYGRSGVMKIENSGDGCLSHDVRVLERLQGGFPQLYSSGTFRDRRMVVMQRLGTSLKSLTRSYRFRTTDILKLGIQLDRRLQDLHSQGFVHRDIHEGNIITGDPREGEGGKMYLIDFGESGHLGGRTPSSIYGNLLFASTAALRLRRYGPKTTWKVWCTFLYISIQVVSLGAGCCLNRSPNPNT